MSTIIARESSQHRPHRNSPSSKSPIRESPRNTPRLPSSSNPQDTITKLASCRQGVAKLEADKRPYADYHAAYLHARDAASKAQFRVEEWQDEYELQCHNHDNNHRVPEVETAWRNLEDAKSVRDAAEQNLRQYEPWSVGNYNILSEMECQQRYLVADIRDLEGCVEEGGARGDV